MKVLVCFKILPDWEQILDEDWDSFNLATDIRYAKRIFNCFDESALEIALRLPDACRTAMTVGPKPPPSFIKSLYAVGFDKVIIQEQLLEFDPAHTANLLAEQAKGYDLILTGRQAGFADTGMVPLLLAEKLRIPVVTEAENVTPCEGGVSVIHQTDFGKERLDVKLPLVVAIGNSPVAALRSATLRQQLQAGKQEPQILPAEESAPCHPHLHQEHKQKDCVFLKEETAQELAAQIYDQFLSGRADACE